VSGSKRWIKNNAGAAGLRRATAPNLIGKDRHDFVVQLQQSRDRDFASITPQAWVRRLATMLQQLPLFGYEAYALLLAGVWFAYGAVRYVGERRAASRRQRALEAGVYEPPSLHPLIDPTCCNGCGACANACPEGGIIGLIGGKAELVEPAACIGHGACKAACPTGAIELVFGTLRRGVDIPVVSPTFESSVRGLYIAGELGGMGLIANAIDQGRQALEAIARSERLGEPGHFDVVIVGGGPAGISATLAAKQKGLSYLTLEQDTLGGTVARYPRGKLIMTRPAQLPLFGAVKLRRARKERLLELWRSVVARTGIEIHQGVRVERIAPTDTGFEVSTTAGAVRTSTVLLATGRRGSPRRLGVPGEELAKVVYSLDDPAQYRGLDVLVVGGGDSALEAAIELARQPVRSVVLSYRGSALHRPRPAARQRLAEAERRGSLRLLLSSHVAAIEPKRVAIDHLGRRMVLANDAVIACTGGVMPTDLLSEIGIRVERKFGTA
jgi:thioredoxin reductase/ferredoxin